MNYNIITYQVIIWNALCEYAKIYNRDFQEDETGWITQVKNIRPTIFKKMLRKNLDDLFFRVVPVDSNDINIVMDTCNLSDHPHAIQNMVHKYGTNSLCEADLDFNQIISITDNFFNKMFKRHYFYLVDGDNEKGYKTLFLKHKGCSDYDLYKILQSIIPDKMLNSIPSGFTGLCTNILPVDIAYDPQTIDSIRNFIFRNSNDKLN